MNRPMGPLFAMARKTDPGTSHDAASTAVSNKEIMAVVYRILSDNKPRTDFEIFLCGRKLNYKYTEQSYRRGRLALERDGKVRKTGNRRETGNGGMGREWEIVR